MLRLRKGGNVVSATSGPKGLRAAPGGGGAGVVAGAGSTAVRSGGGLSPGSAGSPGQLEAPSGMDWRDLGYRRMDDVGPSHRRIDDDHGYSWCSRHGVQNLF
jgi:hypothetical protein